MRMKSRLSLTVLFLALAAAVLTAQEKIDVGKYFEQAKIDPAVKLDGWTRTRIAYFLYDLGRKNAVRLVQYFDQGNLYGLMGIKAADPFSAGGSIDPDTAEDMFLRVGFLDNVKSLQEIASAQLDELKGDDKTTVVIVKLTLKNKKLLGLTLFYNRETHLFFQMWG